MADPQRINPAHEVSPAAALPDGIGRASLTLKILAGIYAVGVFFATIAGSAPTPLLETVAFNVASAALAVLYLLVARALDQGRPWAVSAIRPLLILLVVWGAYAFLSALVAGAFRVPITMLAAGLALLLPAERWPAVRLSARGGGVLVAVAALSALQLFIQPLFGWGGYFDVDEHDLDAALAVDCGAANPPERLLISYEWSWSASTLLPNEEDQIVIGWNGDSADGHPVYAVGDLPDKSDGVNLGISSGVSASMARQAAAPWRGMFMVRLDLKKLGIRPGRIEFVLIRTAALPSAEQRLTIGAAYIHSGVWRSDVPTVTCSW